jgi:hypothetical protein
MVTMRMSLAKKAGIVAVGVAAGISMFAAVALAAPVLPAGTTAATHGNRGTCTNCHAFAAPVVKPPVVTPPVVTPPVVKPPVVTPPVVKPPVVTPPVVKPPVVTPPVTPPAPPVVAPKPGHDDHDRDVAKPAKAPKHAPAKRHKSKSHQHHDD